MASRIVSIFSALEKEMAAALKKQKEFQHPTAIGDGCEAVWLNWFNEYLPERYRALKGTVIDSNGDTSDQIDVIVCDRQYSPFIIRDGNYCFIPAESVYGVFEVKQSIKSENLVYAGNKIASVRKLSRTSAPIVHAGGKYEPKPLFKIIGGILTTDNEYNPPFGTSFINCIKNMDAMNQIDIGCSIEKGSFIIDYRGDGVYTNIQDKDNYLIFFFLHLLGRLQALGTVPAMDLGAYLISLNRPD